jgi:hypothetical protein
MARIVEAIGRYRSGRLSCLEAAEFLGMGERHFRRLRVRYEADGAEGIIDRRRGRLSWRRAAVDQVQWVIAHGPKRSSGHLMCYKKRTSSRAIDTNIGGYPTAVQPHRQSAEVVPREPASLGGISRGTEIRPRRLARQIRSPLGLPAHFVGPRRVSCAKWVWRPRNCG